MEKDDHQKVGWQDNGLASMGFSTTREDENRRGCRRGTLFLSIRAAQCGHSTDRDPLNRGLRVSKLHAWTIRKLGTWLFLPRLEQHVCIQGYHCNPSAFLVLAADCQEGFTNGEYFQAWAALRNTRRQVQSTSAIRKWAAHRTKGTGTPQNCFHRNASRCFCTDWSGWIGS